MGTVAHLPRRAIAPQLDTESLAVGYLFQVRWEGRTPALAHCIEQLMTRHDMTASAAELAAMQAYAEIEASNARARIDINACTSSLVVLREADGHPVALTLADLQRLIHRARREGAIAAINPRRRSAAAVLEH